MARALLSIAPPMQINLLTEPSLPPSTAEKLPATPSQNGAGSSFEDFLGAGKQAAAPQTAAADSAPKTPSPKCSAPDDDEPADKPNDLDPNVAATLAVLALNQPALLPMPQ